VALWKKSKPQPPTRDRGGRIPLHYAAVDSKNDITLERVRLLLAGGQDPNDRDYHGTTPLHMAVQGNGVQTVEALLDAGADPNIEDNDGDAALFYAVNSPWTTPEVVALLRERGADPHHQNHRGSSPLGLLRIVTNKPLLRAIFADLLDQEQP
jgi:ankyrin repeat protein